MLYFYCVSAYTERGIIHLEGVVETSCRLVDVDLFKETQKGIRDRIISDLKERENLEIHTFNFTAFNPL